MPGARDGVAIPGVVCMQCGYNVQGLGVDAVCPECAASVLGSVMVYQPPSPPRAPLPRRVRVVCAVYIPVTIALNAFAGIVGSVFGWEQVEDLRRYSMLLAHLDVVKLVMFVLGLVLLVWLIRRWHGLMWLVMLLEVITFLDWLLPALGHA